MRREGGGGEGMRREGGGARRTLTLTLSRCAGEGKHPVGTRAAIRLFGIVAKAIQLTEEIVRPRPRERIALAEAGFARRSQSAGVRDPLRVPQTMTVGVRVRLSAILAAAATLLLAAPAFAHKPSDSYLSLHPGADATLEGHWDIALQDLDRALTLDRDGDGALTWGEVRGHEASRHRTRARPPLPAHPHRHRLSGALVAPADRPPRRRRVRPAAAVGRLPG